MNTNIQTAHEENTTKEERIIQRHRFLKKSFYLSLVGVIAISLTLATIVFITSYQKNELIISLLLSGICLSLVLMVMMTLLFLIFIPDLSVAQGELDYVLKTRRKREEIKKREIENSNEMFWTKQKKSVKT